MIITLNITVCKDHWNDPNSARNEVELKTDCPDPAGLPWASICAGVVQKAIKEYNQKEKEEAET